MKARLLAVHRYLSLGLALFWMLQALTGLVLVFRWDLDDAGVRGPQRPADFAAIERRIERLEQERPGWKATSIWTSGSGAGRFDIGLEGPSGAERAIRVDGRGEALREIDPGQPMARGVVFDTLTSFHQGLLLGDIGHQLVGISGLLLLSNLMLALIFAMPRARKWRAALLPPRSPSPAGRVHGWHRATGLWLVAPAVVLISGGVAISFEEPLRDWLGAQPASPQNASASSGDIGPASAVARVLERHPSAAVSGVVFPSEDAPWYRIRVLQPGEPRQTFGRTTVYVATGSGEILADHDVLKTGAARRLMDTLYPIHTGQILGLSGRLLSLAVGVWLLALSTLGVWLWAVRRRAIRAR